MSWLLISAGTGPEECHQAVKHLVNYIIQHQRGVECVGYVESRHGFLSAMLSGEDAELERYQGTVKWSCESSIRKGWKRKNWFVTCQLFSEDIPVGFNVNDVKFEATKSSGPGGQHVNKTESAIRATHIPTGISVFAQEERSQHRNKKLAVSRIVQKISELENQKKADKKQEQWMTHNSLERGNENLVFKGPNFQLKR